jgi:phosphoserine phosphatase
MAQKCNVFYSKATLVWVQFEIHFHEFAQNRIQMLKMLPSTFVVHIEVINEHLHEFATQVFKDL